MEWCDGFVRGGMAWISVKNGLEVQKLGVGMV